MKDLIQQLSREKRGQWPPVFTEAKKPTSPPKLETLHAAYQAGETARLSNHSEPDCPYAPGTPEYTQFAEGFCNVKPLIVPPHF